MAKIQILGQFECVTSEGILAVAEQIKYNSTTVAAALDSKQGALTFDSVPTQNSTNPVTSGGVYTSVSSLDSRVTAVENGLGTSSDAASASGTTAWSRIKQNTADVSSVNTKVGASTDSASASGTVVWPRLKNAESDISTIKSGLGTSSDTASASGTTAWSRIKNAESDITTIKSGLGTSSDTASASGTTAWSRIKQNAADITSTNTKIGASTDAASSSSTVVWPRLKSVEASVSTANTNITALQNGLGTSSDTASASGTTAWSRIKNSEDEIATIQAAIAGFESDTILCGTNKTIATSAWTSSGDATYLYKADVEMTGLSASYFPIVQFNDADVAAYDLSPTVVPKTNAVTVYCKTKPVSAITIPNIICLKGKAV